MFDQKRYDDRDIPEIDLPKESWVVEPLPESTRPRKDGPGGENGDDTQRDQPFEINNGTYHF